MNKPRVALIQLHVEEDKLRNIAKGLYASLSTCQLIGVKDPRRKSPLRGIADWNKNTYYGMIIIVGIPYYCYNII